MKKILGLDLGTNSVGWALVEQDFENKQGQILGMGSRIIPMDEKVLGEFGKGNSVSQTAKRTEFRSTRRLYERNHLRRERLHRALNVLGFLPEHYANDIDFEKRLGKFKDETETKLAWKKNGKKENGKDKFEFMFQSAFYEMLDEFKKSHPDLLNRKNKKREDVKIPYDWTIYYLRKKALTQAITKEELAWLILNFNQKRGYYQLRGEEEEENQNKKVEFHSLKVVDVIPDKSYVFTLSNEMEYRYESTEDLTYWKDTERTFFVTTYLDNDGNPQKDNKGKGKCSIILKRKDNETVKSKKGKNPTKVEEVAFRITNVKEETKDEVWYSLILENGWIYRRSSKISLMDWKDKIRDFIVTTDLNDDDTVKTDDEGKESRSYRAPKEDDWILIKKKTENDLENYIAKNKSEKTVGSYIYETLLKNPTQKIRGKLVRTIERKFYKDELKAILEKQIALQPQLFADDMYNACVRELYRSNEAHQLQLSKRDFLHLFLNDIIFYQRPLRSQKSSIGNCSLEFRLHKINKKDSENNPIKNVFEKDKDGNDIEVKEYLKCIPKSNPYYQEFRVWQWLYNLKIYSKKNDEDVTDQFVKSEEDKERLFEFLMSEKEIDHKKIFKYFFKDLKGKAQTAEITKYRWNYVYDSEKDESKTYPMNKTRYEIRKQLDKVENIPANFLTREIEQQLWHIIYSVTDKKEYETALETFAKKHSLHYVPKSERDEKNPDKKCFVYNFKSVVWEEKNEYGSYSEKAIKKLLPLMRLGKYWKWENIDIKTQIRITNLQTAEVDESIKDRVREKVNKEKLDKNEDYQGLPLWLAQYVIYNHHSEAADIGKWNSVEDLKKYLDEFKQHSLRNPIVEQVITETLRVVKDIWQYYGKGVKDFFDEIHIELGREMKNTAEDRKRTTEQISDNENTNQRIKLLLMELKNDTTIEDVRPYSPTQQEILKIYEDGVLNSGIEIPEDVADILKKFKESDSKKQPTKTEINRYKLWLEQKYRSPYTGEVIPLSKLFTTDYQIEHIIPQSRYFDDSLSNKVICESAVNQLKDNQLGLEFIKNHSVDKIQIGEKNVTLFTEDAYRKFVDEHYSKNKAKRTNLLLEDIPDKMIARQLNDTRYISKFVSQLLSNIVREEKDDDGINSKNIIPGNGKITDRLKQDWGLNDAWNELILPRFERMNELLQKTTFTAKNKKGHTIPSIPLELSKGFSKKRIDHRHHAMDALVIACATRNHVNLLNNQSARSDNSRFDLQNKLRNKEKWKDNNGKEHDKFTEFKKPWQSFTVDAKNELEKIVVSFKQNLRVINKATNHYEKIVNGKKVEVEQKGVNWAIRKPMHEETVSGLVNLPWVKLGKGEITTATRERNDLVSIFKDIKTKDKAEDKIKKITDTGIQKILLNYLKSKDNNPELAFSPEGIEDLNKNISQYNNGKFHQPIFKVRTYEKGKGRFILGTKGNKKTKYVQGAPNLFFAIYKDENKKRDYARIPLNEVIERQKQGLSPVPEKNEVGHQLSELCPYLSPNDLVYVPTADELASNSKIDFENLTSEQRKRIYNVNDFSTTCYFTPNTLAKAIAPKEVDLSFDEKKNKLSGSYDTKTASIDGRQIKDICIKLNLDRLGNIKPAK